MRYYKKRKPLTQEQKRNISEGRKGKGKGTRNVSPEARKIFQEMGRKVGLSGKGKSKIFSEEHKKNISLAMRGKGFGRKMVFTPEGYQRKIESLKKRKGKTPNFTPQGLANMAAAGRANKGRLWPVERRDAWATSRTEACQSGRLKPQDNCRYRNLGWFFSKKNNDKILFRSLLELDHYRRLEQDPSVVRYWAEPVRLLYHHRGCLRCYVPDLRIRYTDGRKELVEIKPERQWKYPQNQSKWRAARGWCVEKANTTFCVVGYDFLKDLHVRPSPEEKIEWLTQGKFSIAREARF